MTEDKTTKCPTCQAWSVERGAWSVERWEADDACPACGVAFDLICPLCDGVVSAEDESCPHCGTAFARPEGEDDAGETKDLPFAVELYLPSDLAELGRCPTCHGPMDYSDGLCSQCGQLVCPRCGAAIGDEDEACPKCGLALVFPCPNCKLELTAGTGVCPDCNTLFVQTCPQCGTRIWDGATACPQCERAWELSRYDPIPTTLIRGDDGSPALILGTCPTCGRKFPFRYGPCPTCGHVACPTCEQNLGPNVAVCPRCGPIRWTSDEAIDVENLEGAEYPEEEDVCPECGAVPGLRPGL